MSSGWPRPGLNMVGEYQRSGLPYVTSSNGAELQASAANVIEIKFPRVTRWFEVRGFDAANAASEIRIGFTRNGVLGKGAVTGSYPTGVFNERTGLQEWINVDPLPTTQDQVADSNNYYVIPSTTTSAAPGMRFELMCSSLFLCTHTGHASGFTVIAGLTDIPRTALHLTGSTGHQGVG